MKIDSSRSSCRWLFRFLRQLALLGLLLGAASLTLAKSYTDNADGTLTDPTTGLTWMRCAMGQTWDGSTCTGTAGTYTFDQANALTGTVTFAGQGDWRLPNIRELQTIVDRSVYSPMIDSGAFPNTPSSNFWSGSLYASDSSFAWFIYFDNGLAYFGNSGDGNAVRLVRGGQSLGLLDIARPDANYVDQGDGTVTHTPTGLMWQRCAVGQSWVAGTCSGTANIFTWDGAKLLTDNLAGQTDWRLPTEEELLSLLDYSKYAPAINTTLFPDTPSDTFWSASSSASDSSNAWYAQFSDGIGYVSPTGLSYYARLVRAGQPIDVLAPGAPIIGTATPGSGSASIAFTASIYDGGAAVTGYTATCGSDVGTGASSPVVVTGLTDGTTYVCSVTATNSAGTSAASGTVSVTAGPVPAVSMSPTLISFGSQNISTTSATQDITLSNTGSATLTINSIIASGDYAHTTSCAATLTAGASCSISVSFTPTAAGSRTGAINVSSDAAGSPHNVSLSGTGVAVSAVSLSPGALTFGSQNLGTTSAAQDITLSNTGSATLTINSIIASGDYAHTTSCGTTLDAGANCTISVSFTPTVAGSRTGAISVSSDAAGSPHNVSLNGSGVALPAVSLSTTLLAFNTQHTSLTSAAQVITVSNTGNATLTINSIIASGDYAHTTSCGATLDVGASCTISVTFTPVAAGSRTGAIAIASDAPGSPHSVRLSGTAVAFSANADGTVTDLTSGLTWMRCAMEQTWDGSTCTGTAGTYTFDQANALTGTVTFAGRGDWRLPNIRELQTIVDRSVYSPMIDSGAFPNTPSSNFWSGSLYASDLGFAWFIYFDNGRAYFGNPGDGNAVRLVRGGQSLGLLDIARPDANYVDQGDGTVTHTPTGLMWQRCAVGQSWVAGTCSAAANTFTWDEAKLLTDNLAGHSDWRLPTEEELLSLLDYSKYAPAINTTLFPDTTSDTFWSASSSASDPGKAWYAHFDDGGAFVSPTGGLYAYHARLVRVGQSLGPLIPSLPTAIDFAPQNVGTTSAAQDMTLSNTGTGTLNIASIMASGDYAITTSCGTTLGVGADCSINVTFTPTAAGSRTGAISINSNAPGSPHSVSLSGTGVSAPAVSLSPAALNFGSQNISFASAAQDITLSNTGSATLSLNSIAASGDFARNTNCGATLDAGASCTISVTFTPTVVGIRTGAINVSSDAAGSPHSVSLSGTGVAVPAVLLSPSSLTFGSQNLGTASAPQAITVSSTGDGNLTNISIAASGDFGYHTNCGTTLVTGRTCTILVDFSPTAPGSRTGALTITSSAPSSPDSASLSGTGFGVPAVSLSPGSLIFGTQDLGTTSAAQVITLSNTGVVALSIASINASGDYAKTTTCGASLAAGASCTISVTFTPTAAGSRTGAIIISSDAPGSPHSVSLSGNAYTLSVAKSGTGSGTVSSSPAGINCGSTCSSDYAIGSSVTLTATPAPGSIFTGWSGACTGSAGCVVSMSAARSVMAIFDLTPDLNSGLVAYYPFSGNANDASGNGNHGTVNGATLVMDKFGAANKAYGFNGSNDNIGVNDSPSLQLSDRATLAAWFKMNHWPTDSHLFGLICKGATAADYPDYCLLLGSNNSLRMYYGNSNDVSAIVSGVQLDEWHHYVASFDRGAVKFYLDGVLIRTETVTDTGLKSSANPMYLGEWRNGSHNADGTMDDVRIYSRAISQAEVQALYNQVTPAVALNPGLITFGSQDLGSTSAAQAVSLSNTGAGPLNIASITASGDYARTTTCGASLAAGASCTISVTFTPTAAGSRTGTISISSDAPGSPHSGSLSGTGTGVAAPPTTLANIATRGRVETGDNVMIAGFIIGGSTAKTVLIRARGPSMVAQGVPGLLANPVLNLYSGASVIASNDNWVNAANWSDIQATGMAPTDASEAAILISLSPGPYTAIVTGNGGASGIGIVEVLEIDNPASPLVNIATRGRVQTGDNVMIAGFIISGSAPQTVLIRARGPSMSAYGVPDLLADPVLQLYSGATVIASNDNWGSAANASDIQASGLQPTDARESAILITLVPGPYTAIVTGFGGTTGVAIVEVLAR